MSALPLLADGSRVDVTCVGKGFANSVYMSLASETALPGRHLPRALASENWQMRIQSSHLPKPPRCKLHQKVLSFGFHVAAGNLFSDAALGLKL